MINAAIADGDIVVVRQQPQAENGDIVAALIDGEATVKTLQRANGQVWLMPHNPYSPIPGKKATILGKVVTVLRRVGKMASCMAVRTWQCPTALSVWEAQPSRLPEPLTRRSWRSRVTLVDPSSPWLMAR